MPLADVWLAYEAKQGVHQPASQSRSIAAESRMIPGDCIDADCIEEYSQN